MAETYTLRQEWMAGDVPVLTVAQEGLPADAPLAVVLHGLGGRKESMLPGLYALARLGLRAAAMDVRLHGERPEATAREAALAADYLATTAGIIEGTAQDVTLLLNHFGAGRAAIHGISLGGYIAFAALLSEPRLFAASIAMGSPDWVGPLRRFGLGLGHPAYDRAAALNPLDLLPGVLPPRPLLMLHGEQDEVVPPDGVAALEKRLRPHYAAAPDHLELHLYAGLGHHYTDDMLQRTTAWFERHLAG